MAKRWTRIGSLPDDRALALLADAFELARGNVERAAHVLGISRRQIYRYLHRLEGGWAELDRVRAAELSAFLEAKARLTGRVPSDGVGSAPCPRNTAPSARPSSTPPAG